MVLSNLAFEKFAMVSYYIHVSPSLHMLHLVLFLAYFQYSPTKYLKPPKLVELISLNKLYIPNGSGHNGRIMAINMLPEKFVSP